MRQYGEVPPWVGAGQAPRVSAVTNLGAGGGASVQTKDGNGFGSVIIDTGAAPGVGGNVVLSFPDVPPLLFVSGDEAFGTITTTNNPSASVAINWTAQLPPRRRLHLHYEWSVSK